MSELTAHERWCDATSQGEPYCLTCPDGHPTLPPRRVCPECGSETLEQTQIPTEGTVQTWSTVHVAGTESKGETPYVVALARFDAVTITGRVVGETDATFGIGSTVELQTGNSVDGSAQHVQFVPV